MKLLFAVDLSEPESITAEVTRLASRLGAELYVLHVYVPSTAGPMPIDPMTGFGDMAYAVYDPSVQAGIEEAERQEFRTFVSERFATPVRPALLQGDPARTILDEADRLDVDMLVLGKRHHSALERFLLGSVSESVMYHTRRPVLVVPISTESGSD